MGDPPLRGGEDHVKLKRLRPLRLAAKAVSHLPRTRGRKTEGALVTESAPEP